MHFTRGVHHSLVAFAILVLACSCSTALEDGGREIGLAVSALSVCEEMVPANRNVDGIPAYKQCSASENSAIYSNDGVNTATKKMGPDWIETQYDNGYQCTELVQRYLHFRWHIDWLPPDDAGFWCDSQPPANSGLVQTMKPVHGDIMVLAPGSCGSSDDGHVMLVDIASGGTSLTVVEQNEAMRGPVQLSCAKCFLHVVANDGSGTTVPPAGTAGSGAGSGAPAAGSASPPPSMPRPMTTPPAQPPAAQPPANPVPPAAAEPTAGSPARVPNGPMATTPPPATPAQLAPSTRPSAESATTPDSGGCSIVAGAGAGSGPGSLLVVLAVALFASEVRRRTKYRRNPVREVCTPARDRGGRAMSRNTLRTSRASSVGH